ncbi:DEAD-box ATP-dependent RNA helicase 39 [Tanacetum coccineum]
MYNTSISTHPLQTLHFLKVPENSLEMLKVLENKFESLKVLENNLKSLKLQENRLVPENSLEVLKVMENKFELLKVLENNLKLLKVLENNLESLKLQENRLVDGLLLRQDEAVDGMVMKPRRPRAVVLCPTRELCELVFGVAKSISHHARFWSTMVSGGGRIRPQEEALNSPIDMVVGTPGRVLQNIEEGNLVYGDINICHLINTYLRVGDIDLTVIGDENIAFSGCVLLRQDEAVNGMVMKPRRPRAVVLCPTRELCEQVFGVAKSISHHARFWSTMVSGGGRIRPQEEALNSPIDMVVGTPGRVLQNIEEGNLVYGDINICSAPLVLDEADMMFDRGFGPDIRKFLAPLNNRALKADGLGFQTVLVTATMTNGIQKLVDEEFQGIEHIRTPTLHKKVAAARYDFIKLSGAKNKLEALLQVVFEPKFKSNDGDCPTLVCIVCTDLAARGLDLNVHQKWIEGGNYELCIEDVRNEIWDMVKPADPLRITLSDLLSCKQGGTVASRRYLVVLNDFTYFCEPEAELQFTLVPLG